MTNLLHSRTVRITKTNLVEQFQEPIKPRLSFETLLLIDACLVILSLFHTCLFDILQLSFSLGWSDLWCLYSDFDFDFVCVLHFLYFYISDARIAVAMPPSTLTEQTQVGELPLEIVALVLLCLPLDARLRAREVSQDWRALLNEPRFWLVLDFSPGSQPLAAG